LAAGLGINALLAYTLVRTMTWPQAMGLVVWEGILITILVLTGISTQSDIDKYPYRPARIVDSVAELVEDLP